MERTIPPHAPNLMLRKIGLISFAAAICVIFIHAFNMAEYNVPKDGILGVVERFLSLDIALFAVPFFFTISGYFMGRGGSIYASLRKRIKSILVPYLLWNAIYTFLFFAILCLGINLNSFSLADFSWVKGIFLGKYVLVSWFLFQLILLSILTPIIHVLTNNKTLGLAAISSFFILNLFCNNIYFFKTAPLVFYSLGMFIAKHLNNIFTNCTPSKNKAIIALFLFLASQAIYWGGGGTLLAGDCIGAPISLYAAFCILLNISIWLFFDFINIMPKTYMGYTFFIFLAHDFLLEAFQKLIYLKFPHTVAVAALDYFCTPALVLFLLTFAAAILSVKAPFLWNPLNGYRKNRVAAMLKGDQNASGKIRI